MSKPAQRGGRRSKSGTDAPTFRHDASAPKRTRLPDPTLTLLKMHPGGTIGRIPVVNVAPVVNNGKWPAKAVTGEAVAIHATVFREGHDAFGASAVLQRPDGSVHSRTTMVDISPGNDRYEGWVIPDAPGQWSFYVEGWADPYATWVHDAGIKIPAGIDVELMFAEGALILDRAAGESGLSEAHRVHMQAGASGLRDTTRPPQARWAAGISEQVRAALAASPLRDLVSPTTPYPLVVHRERALFGAWYEFFPRSEGAYFDEKTGEWVTGTFQTAADRLDGIAEMGFDFAYLTPVHPIGVSNRKGRNNTLHAEEGDPGSPYAIGSEAGGHDSIEPSLGTFTDFDAFVAKARSLDLEVAMDLALQCSPDHPWVKEHPQWFTTRVDGTIAYAENPPKKYQDIYPLNFDNDPEGIYQEILRIVQLWIAHGVTAFRVDNPHTKPLMFWERLLAEVAKQDPHVVFLAEAFTRPAMMRTLGAIGFHQSYTYFTWRHTKQELGDYFLEVSDETSAVMRPSFWPTTHEILTPYMQQGGASAFAIRAILAAMGSPTWGIYSGYEFAENIARPGAQEQIDNEKYEFKPRDWSRADDLGLTSLLTRLNLIRREHPALHRLRGLTVHATGDDATFCFSRKVSADHSPTAEADIIIVVVNLDPHAVRESTVSLNIEALGIHSETDFAVHDLLSGETFAWGAENYVRLDPVQRPAHIFHVRSL